MLLVILLDQIQNMLNGIGNMVLPHVLGKQTVAKTALTLEKNVEEYVVRTMEGIHDRFMEIKRDALMIQAAVKGAGVQLVGGEQDHVAVLDVIQISLYAYIARAVLDVKNYKRGIIVQMRGIIITTCGFYGVVNTEGRMLVIGKF